MLVKGEKIKLVNPMGMFTNVGEICEVVDVSESGVISFKFGNGMHMGCMSREEFDKYFEKYEEPKCEPNSIEDILANSEFVTNKVFDKCTVVSCRLPNGFVIVEYSACVNPEDYNEEVGVDNCLERIYVKVAEMEAYKQHFDMCKNEYRDCYNCESNYEEDEYNEELCDKCVIKYKECPSDCSDCDCPYEQ